MRGLKYWQLDKKENVHNHNMQLGPYLVPHQSVENQAFQTFFLKMLVWNLIVINID